MLPMALSLPLPDVTATRALGLALGRLAPPGTAVALSGPLGAGKTTVAKAVGEGLGVAGPVISPTFQILAVYEDGRLTLAHADLYRIGDASELDELGLDELLVGDVVALVEWAERFSEVLPADHLHLALDYDGDGRQALVSATGPRSEALVSALREALDR